MCAYVLSLTCLVLGKQRGGSKKETQGWGKPGFCFQLCSIQCDISIEGGYDIVGVNALIPIWHPKALWVSCSSEFWNIPYY